MLSRRRGSGGDERLGALDTCRGRRRRQLGSARAVRRDGELPQRRLGALETNGDGGRAQGAVLYRTIDCFRRDLALFCGNGHLDWALNGHRDDARGEPSQQFREAIAFRRVRERCLQPHAPDVDAQEAEEQGLDVQAASFDGQG